MNHSHEKHKHYFTLHDLSAETFSSTHWFIYWCPRKLCAFSLMLYLFERSLSEWLVRIIHVASRCSTSLYFRNFNCAVKCFFELPLSCVFSLKVRVLFFDGVIQDWDLLKTEQILESSIPSTSIFSASSLFSDIFWITDFFKKIRS
jgi:hypothetical protein